MNGVRAPVLHLSIPVSDLAAAKQFYETAVGCEVGRVRDDWLDVWFFGMQLTLQERPEQVRPAAEQGVRHFGVILPDAAAYAEVIGRLRAHGVEWVSAPAAFAEAELSGKTGAKVADPSGNVIEIKHYDDPANLRGR